jgi:hypothetical protein
MMQAAPYAARQPLKVLVRENRDRLDRQVTESGLPSTHASVRSTMYSGQRCACGRRRAREHGRCNDDVTSVQPAPQSVTEMKA